MNELKNESRISDLIALQKLQVEVDALKNRVTELECDYIRLLEVLHEVLYNE